MNKSPYIREFCVSPSGTSAICIIRLDHYGHSAQVFKDLVDEVLKDFPEFPLEEISIAHYGGSHYRRTYGVEFRVDVANVPSTYERVLTTELRL